MKKRTLYLRLLAAVALIGCGVYHELISAVPFLSMAAVLPFGILRSPEGDGGGGDGGGDTVTLSKKEYEEQLQKRLQTGIAEGKDRATKQFTGLFGKFGITVTEDSIEKTLETLSNELKQSKVGKDDQMQALEQKIKSLTEENNQIKNGISQAELDRDNYIINNEIMNAAAVKSAAPADVAFLLRQNIKVERLKDGSVCVYDRSGTKAFNAKGDPMTVAEAVDLFLNERPYLVKSELKGGGDGGKDISGTPSDIIAKGVKDPMSLSSEERKKFLETA